MTVTMTTTTPASPSPESDTIIEVENHHTPICATATNADVKVSTSTTSTNSADETNMLTTTKATRSTATMETATTDCNCDRQVPQQKRLTVPLSALDEDEFYPKTFQDELNEIMEAFYSVISEDDMYAYQSFIEDIAEKKVAEGAVDKGDVAPDFILQDQDGDTVRLHELVQQGPVVVVFYRGKWCPHCNATIMAMSKAYPKIKSKGASFIAISPMLPDGTQFLATKSSLLFPVCSDVGNVVARKFRITFEVQPEIRSRMVEWGEDVPCHNGDDSWVVPLPCAYIIGEDGRIVWRFIDNDPGVRASPDQIINAIPQSTKSIPTGHEAPEEYSGSQEYDYDDDTSLLTTDDIVRRYSWNGRSSPDKELKGGSCRNFNRRHLSSTFKNCKAHVRRVFGRRKQPAKEYMSEFLFPQPDEETSEMSSHCDQSFRSIKSLPH